MGAIRKLVSVKPEHYPSKKVAAKVQKTLLNGETVKFFTRKDIKQILKSGAFAKAPRTEDYLKELNNSAKEKGAYYIRLTA